MLLFAKMFYKCFTTFLRMFQCKTFLEVVTCKIKHQNIFTSLQMFYFTCNHGLTPKKQAWYTKTDSSNSISSRTAAAQRVVPPTYNVVNEIFHCCYSQHYRQRYSCCDWIQCTYLRNELRTPNTNHSIIIQLTEHFQQNSLNQLAIKSKYYC